ncbi:MAG TPA: WYL domain-containing protein, partial [Bryobacteraceae bacterium]
MREAVLTGRRLSFHYHSEVAEAPAWRDVVPYGLLYGHRIYLVAAFPWETEPVNYRLDRMSELRVSDARAARPQGFDLDAYAARSFGVFQEEPHDVALRFVPEVVDEVANFQFHPSQTIMREADGSTIVRFRAGGASDVGEMAVGVLLDDSGRLAATGVHPCRYPRARIRRVGPHGRNPARHK